MSENLKGILIHTEIFGWQVRYEFGENQIKHLVLHENSIQRVNEFGIEGEEVSFIIRGTSAPKSLNGVISSAYILFN